MRLYRFWQISGGYLPPMQPDFLEMQHLQKYDHRA